MPSIAEHSLDKEFTHLIMNKKYKAAFQMLPQYASMAKVESGGRHVAMLLGVIGEECTPVYMADGQSSGSWNPLITFEKIEVSNTKQSADQEYVK